MFFKKQIMKTFFPRLRSEDKRKHKHGEDSTPGLEEISSDDDDDDDDLSCASSGSGTHPSNNDKYQTKEDEDVAMFLTLIDKMSIKSLLFILQNHAREVHKIPEQQLQQAIGGSSFRNLTTATSSSSSSTSTKRRTVTKKFRFAEILGGTRIREQVLEIPHASEFSPQDLEELWWTKDEQQRMRFNARKAVKFYAKHRPLYHESMEYLVDSHRDDSDDILVEHHVKKLANDSFPRGLECHIIKCLGDHRKAGVEAVLEEQAELDLDGISQDTDEALERIRNRYRLASLPSRTLSRQLARCDHIEALKCSLSSWEAGSSPTPAATATTTTSCASTFQQQEEARRQQQLCRWKS